MSRIKSIVLSSAFALSGLMAVAPAAHAAGSASLGLSPAGGSHAIGSTFSVSVYENSGGTAVNGAEADLNFNSSQLELLGKSCGSAFEITAPAGGNSLTCATVTPKSGSQVVGTVSFKALAAGSAGVNFAPSSQITAADGSGTNVWNGDTSGASFSFYTPAPVAAAPTTPAATPQVKKAVTHKGAGKTVTYRAPVKDASGISAWIYVPAGIILVLAGLAYIFRERVAKAYKSTSKSYRKMTKNMPKVSLAKAFQRS